MEETNKSPLLWEAIVSNDDVCFKHVLPKLNQTDLKFLYDVNSETRKLIKRARPFGIELKCAFKIAEMSSISTLEFAWKNRLLWDMNCDGEKMFCYQVARTNKLELLKWAREEEKCKWDTYTFNAAAEQGNLEMVKYCVANGCPVNELACACAAKYGHLECLKYLHEVAKAPWDLDWRTAWMAAENGHLHILEYLVERKFDDFDDDACAFAAENGHLNCLKYLHEVAKAPWDSRTASWAAKNGHLHILEYLVECKFDYFDEKACYDAAENGHLDCLKYLHEVAKAPWDERTAHKAAYNGHLHILEYLVERKFDYFDERACTCAAMKGHLDCLKFLHEVAKVPWGSSAVRYAHEYHHPECLQYLLDNDCPLPEGWQYEHGVLYASESELSSSS
jgi:ankyrin repeat protein